MPTLYVDDVRVTELVGKYAAEAHKIYVDRTEGDLTWEGLLGTLLRELATPDNRLSVEDMARLAVNAFPDPKRFVSAIKRYRELYKTNYPEDQSVVLPAARDAVYAEYARRGVDVQTVVFSRRSEPR